VKVSIALTAAAVGVVTGRLVGTDGSASLCRRATAVILLRRPSAHDIRVFIDAQAALPFSYEEVGATRGTPPAGYTVDRNRIRLGRGHTAFERGVAALRQWRMFAIDGVELCWPSASIATGTTVGVLAHAAGLWSLNACRVVYVVDERAELTRYGFAYGTLPEHAVRGEERFLIEWSAASDEVVYDLLAFSQPSSALLGAVRPLLRRMQRRFARRSLEAMRRAAAE
jgi:uncharacterized protein (UPF0548 family)